jgi:hypothetical protein
VLDFNSFYVVMEWAFLYLSKSKLVSIKNSFKSGLLFNILFDGNYFVILLSYFVTLSLAPDTDGSDSLYFR